MSDRSKRIAVVTDSAACVPPELVRAYGIGVVPFQLIWDGQTYRDGVDLAPEAFYRRFRTSDTYPTTSQPTLASFLETYRALAAEAVGIASVHVAGNLTSGIQVARQAAQEMPDVDIRVIDTHTAAPCEGFVAVAAARAARDGANLEEVVAVAEACREKVGMFFTMETLEHLRRGGRIGQAATLLGSRLHIQPVLTLPEGEVRPIGLTRGRHRAQERMLSELTRAVGDHPVRIAVFHADVPDEALALGEVVRQRVRCIEYWLANFTPVMGAHTGPGILGVCYCLEDEAV
jgi:DegV family protein with EDD domain